MTTMITCPTCKTNYEEQPQTCPKCGYPFVGTEKEKATFIAQQILKKGYVADSTKRVANARIMLWILGGLNIIQAFLILRNNYGNEGIVIQVIIIGLVFIGCGFYTRKKPIVSVLIPLIIILLSYTVDAIISPATLFRGLLWKGIYLSVLIIALVSAIKAEKIKKESEFLQQPK